MSQTHNSTSNYLYDYRGTQYTNILDDEENYYEGVPSKYENVQEGQPPAFERNRTPSIPRSPIPDRPMSLFTCAASSEYEMPSSRVSENYTELSFVVPNGALGALESPATPSTPTSVTTFTRRTSSGHNDQCPILYRSVDGKVTLPHGNFPKFEQLTYKRLSIILIATLVALALFALAFSVAYWASDSDEDLPNFSANDEFQTHKSAFTALNKNGENLRLLLEGLDNFANVTSRVGNEEWGKIAHPVSGMCVGVGNRTWRGGVATQGTKVQLLNCEDNSERNIWKWDAERRKLEHQSSEYCLDVADSAIHTEGAAIQLWSCNENQHQWRVNSQEVGKNLLIFQLQSPDSEHCVHSPRHDLEDHRRALFLGKCDLAVAEKLGTSWWVFVKEF